MNIELLIGLIAAGAWIPYIFEKIKQPKLVAKISQLRSLTLYSFQEEEIFPKYLDKKNSTIYIIRYKLLVENMDFLIDTIETRIKYKGIKEEKLFKEYYSAEIYYDYYNVGKRIDIGFDTRVIGHGVMKSNIGYDLYSTVFINESNLRDIEYIRLTISNLKGKKLKAILKYSENDDELIRIPDEYWSKETIA